MTSLLIVFFALGLPQVHASCDLFLEASPTIEATATSPMVILGQPNQKLAVYRDSSLLEIFFHEVQPGDRIKISSQEQFTVGSTQELTEQSASQLATAAATTVSNLTLAQQEQEFSNIYNPTTRAARRDDALDFSAPMLYTWMLVTPAAAVGFLMDCLNGPDAGVSRAILYPALVAAMPFAFYATLRLVDKATEWSDLFKVRQAERATQRETEEIQKICRGQASSKNFYFLTGQLETIPPKKTIGIVGPI